MRRWLWLLVALQARCLAQTTPTVCQDESCQCDSFTRVICRCINDYDEVTLRPDGAYRVPPTTTAIIINGCARVYFLQDTARELHQLRSVELTDIHHLYFMERSLAWYPYARELELANPGLRISIKNSTVNEFASHAVKGRIDDILISDSRIDVIRPFAFSSLTGVKNLELANNVFVNVEIQAFKKFTTVNFILRGGSIQTLPSRFLSDVEVTNLFRMEGVTVKQASSVAFLVSGPKRVLIERNYIHHLGGDCFHMTTRGPVTFRNNIITFAEKGAFLGFSVEPEVISVLGRQELLIDNNTVTYISPPSLRYNQTSVTLRVEGLNLNKSCTCELADEWKDVLSEQGGTLACWYGLEGHYVAIPTYVDSRCGRFKQNFWIFIVVGVVFILLIGVIVIFFIVRRENVKKKKVQIVMPDGKTYRETEFHIVVERAELLTTDL